MRRIACLVITALALAACPAVWAGTIVFDNFGPGDTYDTGGWWFGNYTGGSVIGGADFTPSQSGVIGDIWTGMSSSVRPATITMSLYTDAGNEPGTVLWSQTFVDAVDDWGSVTHLAVTSGPTITAGTLYWLIGLVPSEITNTVSWWQNVIDDKGIHAQSSDGGATWSVNTNPDLDRETFRIGLDDGDPIPLPGTLFLILTGGGVIAVSGRRRRQER